jgi:hypothetical protein
MQHDPARQAFLEQELERIKERVKRDWHAADYLRDELGQPPLPPLDEVFNGAAAGTPGVGSAGFAPNPHADPMDLVNDGEFASRSSTTAAEMLLQKVGRTRPLKLGEIFKAIKKGGVEVAAQQSLHRSLTRSKKFCKPGRGLWALSEWYTAAELKRMEQRGAAESDSDGDDDADGESAPETPQGEPTGEEVA